MKKYIVLCGLLIWFNSLQSQNFARLSRNYVDLKNYYCVDSAYLRCSYKLSYSCDTLNKDIQSTDKQTLLIGQNASKYYSQIALDYNQYIKEYIKRNHDYPNASDGAWTYEVFKNYPQGKSTVTDIGSALKSDFLYEEDLPIFNWEITREKQTILSYNCQKATTTFRGRDYTAWFTTDIPIDNGPWKFAGLPGLILKLYDSNENFVFECEGLEYLRNKEPIKFYKLNYAKIEREDLYKLYKRIHDDRAAYNKTLGIMTMEMDEKTRTSKIVDYSSSKIPYNPIELK
jgi:Protein of unknown function (Porph_ging).